MSAVAAEATNDQPDESYDCFPRRNTRDDEGPLSLLTTESALKRREERRLRSEMFEGIYDSIEKWRRDYTVEMWRADRDRRKRRDREENERKKYQYTPPPSPGPDEIQQMRPAATARFSPPLYIEILQERDRREHLAAQMASPTHISNTTPKSKDDPVIRSSRPSPNVLTRSRCGNDTSFYELDAQKQLRNILMESKRRASSRISPKAKTGRIQKAPTRNSKRGYRND